MNINIIYGSTTGATQAAAEQIASILGGKAISIVDANSSDFDTDLLILGVSTWGFGDLQDDWEANLPMLESANLQGRKVALFGQGDQSGFSDTFQDAMATLAEAAEANGAVLVGEWSADGYTHSASRAVRGDNFIGLALDESNEPEKTDDRIATWCEQLKAVL